MDEQLNLFDNNDNQACYRIPNKGYQDWEVDSHPEVFGNNRKSLPEKKHSESSKLFDNNNSITEKSVSEYQPGGTASKSNKYYRFSYRKNNKVKHLHIKGGNISNPLAIKRKELVEAWIREDVALEKIIKWIKEW